MICEKPLFFTVAECEEVAAIAARKGLIVGVTYGFTGHPLVHQMAAMVRKGLLGEIRLVDLRYTHGFYAGDDVGAGEALKWRTNPRTAGPTFVLGDIGTHLYYLSEVVLPHLRIERLCATARPSSRPGRLSRTMPPSSCTTITARAAISGFLRSTPATWAASATASLAPRRPSNGPTAIPTS